MKKIIKIILISILILPIISLHSYTKATDFGEAIDSDELSFAQQAEMSERDSDIEKAIAEGKDADEEDDEVGEDSELKGFSSEDSSGDEESDDDEIDLDDPDSIIEAADEFVDGDIEETLDIEETNKNVNSVYNILLTIGIIVSLVWGVVLGIKFIFGSMEGKAQIKKQLIPYIIWVCVIFGSFIIWSIVVNTFQNNL